LSTMMNDRQGISKLGFIFILGFLSGCRLPPAQIDADSSEKSALSRREIHRRQVIRDSAAQIAFHPLAAAKLLLLTPINHWWTVGTSGISSAADWRPAEIHIYTSGQEALAALHQIIAQASKRIDVVMFIWNSDPLGEDLARRLAAKAGPELPVRVLVDGGGNLLFGLTAEASADQVDRVIAWLAQQPYVQVIRSRNPCWHYDHRKLVLADCRMAWTGGRNFTEPGFFRQHDLALTVTGPPVEEIQDSFDRSWKSQGGAPIPRLPIEDSPEANACARLIGTDPPNLEIERAVYRAVAAAQDRIFLENFTLCDGPLMRKLIRAKRRGVDVRVVTTLENTNEMLNRANKVVANRLFQAGIRVYLFPGMMHVKALVVDGSWAYTGTGNFDPISLRRNRELGLEIGAGDLVTELEQRLLQPDIQPEWEMKETFPVSPKDRFLAIISRIAF